MTDKSVLNQNISRTLIILLLILAGGFFLLDGIYTEPISDELLYRFKLGKAPLGDETSFTPLTNLADVIESQSNQYFASNGRFIVHLFVQAFAGLMPRIYFDIFNTILFLLTIFLVMKYCSLSKENFRSPFLWFLCILAYFYGFPGAFSLFMSPPGAFNYLYPMALIVGFLLLWRYIARKSKVHPFIIILTAVYAFVTGWSQECFAIPLSAATFIYAIINWRKLNFNQLLILVFLYIGTAILVFAPGNFVRLESSGRTGISGYVMSCLTALQLLKKMKLIWILAIVLIIAKISKYRVGKFLKANSIISLSLLFALLLGFMANTLPQSFTGIEFFSLLLTLRILNDIYNKFTNKAFNITTIAFSIIFIAHQCMIVDARHSAMISNQKIVSDYLNAENGVVIKPKLQLSPLVAKYSGDWTRSTVLWWTTFTLEEYYSGNTKKMHLLTDEEYKALNSFDSLLGQQPQMPNGINTVLIENRYWVRVSTEDTAKNIRLSFYPIKKDENPSWYKKVKSKFNSYIPPNAIEKKVSEYEYIEQGDSILVAIGAPINRRIKSIELIEAHE